MFKKVFAAIFFFICVSQSVAAENPISVAFSSGSIPAETIINQSYTATYSVTSHLPFVMPTPLSISSSSSQEMSLTDHCTGIKLSPSQSCDVTVSLTPANPGNNKYNLNVTYGRNVVPFNIINTHSTGTIESVKHIIVIMQENHSFDNYFGVLPYVKNGPYHAPRSGQVCNVSDNQCVDGLTCSKNKSGSLTCTNFNYLPTSTSLCDAPVLTSTPWFSFHNTDYCVSPNLQHEWQYAHQEANLFNPNDAFNALMNGYANVNELCGDANIGKYETLGYYDQNDLGYYYGLAQTFTTSDRYFSSSIGPTLLNRLYLYDATSFGHISTDDAYSPGENTKPKLYPNHLAITGSIFDLLDSANISWKSYHITFGWPEQVTNKTSSHFSTIGNVTDTTTGTFYGDNARSNLPSVVFIDTNEYDEHPPRNILAGQYYVAKIINAIRQGPNWKDSVIIFTYDEHGGYYDHVVPPVAVLPDNITPGVCKDAGHPGGSTCANMECCPSETELTKMNALKVTPSQASATFDQLGIRVPFVVVSPFVKSSYVSHIDRDHTSILAFIEKRFLNNQHLTARDAAADPFSDLFDFNARPSLSAEVSLGLARVVTDVNTC